MTLKEANNKLKEPGWKMVSCSGLGNTLYMKPNEEKDFYDCIQISGLGFGSATIYAFKAVISVENIKLYEQGVKIF